MSENFNQTNEFKIKFILFFKNKKIKILILFLIISLSLISYFFYQLNLKKNHNLISEKYILAGLYFSSGEKEKSKKLFEEIISGKDKFYTSLALYSILEKDLEDDKQKILIHFDNAEKSVKSKSKKIFYLLKSIIFIKSK